MDARTVLAPDAPSAVMGMLPADDEVSPELLEAINLSLIGEAGFSETYGWMWGIATANANRLRLDTHVELNGTSLGHGEAHEGQDYLLPFPAHSLNSTARAAVQDDCGATANGRAHAVAYNEAPISSDRFVTISRVEATKDKTAAQPRCEASTEEESTDQPIGGGGGGSQGDSGDCELWGHFVNGILIYTYEVGTDC